MRIVSWNVNGIRACMRKGFVDFANQVQADVLGVQETKAWPDQVEELPKALEAKELYWASASKKGYSGTLSICKSEPQCIDFGIGIERFDTEGRFVITEVNGILIYNIYFPNGAASEERHFYKMDFLDAIFLQIQSDLERGKSVIVMGDYNIAHTSIDIHDPVRLDGTSGFKPEERDWMDRFFSLGMLDSFRHIYPEQKDAYSWWSYRARSRERNKGWRIDYISVSPDLKDRLTKVEILNHIEGSDHCPILLEFRS